MLNIKQLIGTTIKHTHWCIWSFCLLYLVFRDVINMPLDFLYSFNYIPEYILNLSEIINTKTINATQSSEITQTNEFLDSLKETVLFLQRELTEIKEKMTTMLTLIESNNALVQSQINFQEKFFSMVNIKLSNIVTSKDILNIGDNIKNIESILQIQGNGQIDIAAHIISNVKDVSLNINNLSSNVLRINEPLLTMQENLNQVIYNQQELQNSTNQLLDINIQGFNNVFLSHDSSLTQMQTELDKTFTKIHEIRNHNLEIAKHLDNNIGSRIDDTETHIINKLSDEISRQKTSNTDIKGKVSWSNFFDKKD